MLSQGLSYRAFSRLSFSLFKKTSFSTLGTYSVGIWWNEFLPLLVAPFTSLPHSHLGKCPLAMMKSSSHWTHLNVAPRDRVTSCPLDEQEAKSTHLVRNRLPQLFFYMCDGCFWGQNFLYWVTPSVAILVNIRKHYYVGIMLLSFLWNHAWLSWLSLMLGSFDLKCEITPVCKFALASIAKTQSFCFSHSFNVLKLCAKRRNYFFVYTWCQSEGDMSPTSS